jgi:tRNA-specific 2-thiouridylase
MATVPTTQATTPPPRALPGRGVRVVAALSGGVDSAVAAALLVEAGCEVIGMTMRLYDAGGTSAAAGRCCGPRDIDDARAVCAHLGIPHYVVDLADAFERAVIDDFVDGYLAGATPNPCVRCNQHIKFTPLLAQARQIGAQALVTGHYARIADDGAGGLGLFRGVDAGKDQSYFLFSMPAEALPAVHFPLGGLGKGQVRAEAARLGLPNARKAESHEICFVPDGDHAGFVAAAALRRGRPGPAAGPIVDDHGQVVGQHDGSHRFTIGQHRGLGNLRTRERLFVTALEPATGTVRVGPRAAAERSEVAITDLRWLVPVAARPVAHAGPVHAAVQVRYRSPPITGAVAYGADVARVVLEEPTVAAPGQAAVIYAGDQVVAGGWIT